VLALHAFLSDQLCGNFGTMDGAMRRPAVGIRRPLDAAARTFEPHLVVAESDYRPKRCSRRGPHESSPDVPVLAVSLDGAPRRVPSASSAEWQA
jgi:hypothetical protein